MTPRPKVKGTPRDPVYYLPTELDNPIGSEWYRRGWELARATAQGKAPAAERSTSTGRQFEAEEYALYRGWADWIRRSSADPIPTFPPSLRGGPGDK